MLGRPTQARAFQAMSCRLDIPDSLSSLKESLMPLRSDGCLDRLCTPTSFMQGTWQKWLALMIHDHKGGLQRSCQKSSTGSYKVRFRV